ncbi:lysine-rich arabinogalactan protein 19-like [Penaeus chinensis]|uniref:lysine-rich arabinogalactan protein 19-like n=1 Tax=Penaeus chinensis TaxID=139456 RepID=UPI001FB84060|nr:lysine-rich arabinogalactan protein 19-like [Penaeus chinensis]
MHSTALCLLALASGALGVLPGPPASPWVDTSMCPPTDSLMECQLKKGQCSPVGSVFSPPGGPVKAITSCANTTGVVLGPQFFMSIGLAFVTGKPESLPDMISTDAASLKAIRRCSLNATGLLSNDTTLNRTAVAASISTAFSIPAVAAAVASAVASCPEPVDYKISDFITCLRTACMNNVVVSPFVPMAASPVQSSWPAPSVASSPYVGSSPSMKFSQASAPSAPSSAPPSTVRPPYPVRMPATMGIPPYMASLYSMQTPPAAASYSRPGPAVRTLPFTGVPGAMAQAPTS